MTKITIINCIIAAVCIFQTAEAGLLNPLGSLVDTVQNQFSNTVENVKELGKEGIQNGKDTYDRLTDGLVAPQTGLSTSTSCTNASKYIQEAATQVTKIFNTCIIKINNSTDIKELINATKNLQNISKNFQDVLNCIYDENIVECLGYVKKNVSEIITKIIDTSHQTVFVVKMCLETGIKQLTNEAMSQIIQSVDQCVQNFTFTLPFKL
ncbi:PREDICTED: uncharacterized protein LOC105627273 [Atta cephalotes]|uniref:Protein TsetseEP domain-containing protein n=1 Tax=Atta cephalotes TaxID=12957 RepID=A0A158P2E2_ATTCE|nr:PREDICTED: uncharacterized protein LOC105627273 [Atta cephalotes]